MKTVSELIDLLALEKLDTDLYRGYSTDIGSPIVFGGQVLAQSLHAAYQTVCPDRMVHSLHSYFLESGDLKIPIEFKVQRLRDGGSFSTRRVTAVQHGRPMFLFVASFHKSEKGFDYSGEIPIVDKQPEDLMSWDDILTNFSKFLPKGMKNFLSIDRPIVFKPLTIFNPLERKDLPPNLQVWFKVKGDIPELSLSLKHQILTYISDYNLLSTCLQPHASEAHFGNSLLASLDHSMWFHRDFDINQWLLLSTNVVNNYGARGLVEAKMYTKEGKLVATLTQEGLIRKRKK